MNEKPAAALGVGALKRKFSRVWTLNAVAVFLFNRKNLVTIECESSSLYKHSVKYVYAVTRFLLKKFGKN